MSIFKVLLQDLREIAKKKIVLQQLIKQQLILRYRRTLLGYLWSLLNPLLSLAVTTIVFSSLFHINLKDYLVYFVAGFIAWNCFNSIILQSSNSIVSNESLIKKIYLPKIIFPLSTSLASIIDSFFSLTTIYFIICIFIHKFSLAFFFIPIAYFLLFCFAFGLALIFSVLTVFFRDLQQALGLLMQAWFFLTPIIYQKEFASDLLVLIIRVNPITPFIDLFRQPLYLGILPAAEIVVPCSILAFISLAIGFYIFVKFQDKLIFRL